MPSTPHMPGLTMINLDLDKEKWENVPGITFHSFKQVSQTLTNVKKWADASERRFRTTSEQVLPQLDDRIAQSGSAVKETQQHIKELTAELRAIAEQQGLQRDTFALCIRQLLAVTRVFFETFGRSFGVELPADPGGGKPADGPAEGRASPAMSVGNDSPRPLQHGVGTDMPAVAESAARVSGVASSVNAAQPPDELAALRDSGAGLEACVEGLGSALDRWSDWRQTQVETNEATGRAISDLQVAAERSRERLLAWREMLKESSHVVEALNAALVSTQDDVRELQQRQVRREDVEEVVGQAAAGLEEQLGEAERRVDGIAESIGDHMADVDRLMKDMSQQVDVQIEQQTGRVAQMLESHLNPINAYLNTMHVKTDTIRSELDALSKRAVDLGSSIDDVADKVGHKDEESRARSVEIGSRFDSLEVAVGEDRDRRKEQHDEHTDAHRALSADLGTQLQDARASSRQLAEQLEAVKRGEVASLHRDLALLEQKVAKWVHSQPLPAKISEARLYALEARLAEEMDCRLRLEDELRSLLNPPGYPSRHGSGVALPLLPMPAAAADTAAHVVVGNLSGNLSARKMRKASMGAKAKDGKDRGTRELTVAPPHVAS